MPEPVVLGSVAALAPWLSRWDALAVTAGRPYCAPGWMLAWWEHQRPTRADLRVVLVADGDELRGVAPFFLHRGRAGRRDARVLCAGHSHRLDLLATPGAGRATAAAVASALAPERPSLISFEGFEAGSEWPAAVGRAWPARRLPAPRVISRQPTPIVTLDPAGHAAWLASQSKNFRKKTGQAQRRLEQEGGRVALACEPPERQAAIDAFVRLHAQRWEERGGSALEPGSSGAMLRAACSRLPADRLRLWTVTVGEEIVAVQVFVAAGDELANWNGGWDERHARVQPPLLALLAAMDDAVGRGERRIDMGGGDDHYKQRFADASLSEEIVSAVLLPAGARTALTRLELLPGRARRALRPYVRRVRARRV
jgi:CelD/BcsL family acetyltransferase involved in cellulose biosynthesis